MENKKSEQRQSKEGGAFRHPAEVGRWFQMICFMNIPVFGVLFLLIKLLRKSTPAEQRSFAAAYLIYRFLVLLLAGTVVFILYQVGLDFIGELLKYADRTQA